MFIANGGEAGEACQNQHNKVVFNQHRFIKGCAVHCAMVRWWNLCSFRSASVIFNGSKTKTLIRIIFNSRFTISYQKYPPLCSPHGVSLDLDPSKQVHVKDLQQLHDKKLTFSSYFVSRRWNLQSVLVTCQPMSLSRGRFMSSWWEVMRPLVNGWKMDVSCVVLPIRSNQVQRGRVEEEWRNHDISSRELTYPHPKHF